MEQTPTPPEQPPKAETAPTPALAPTPAPAPEAAPVPAKTTGTEHRASNAVQIVLQWLTYSLWSWALCALTILLSATLSYFFVEKGNNYDFLIYVLASLIVLLPLAFIADRIYSKMEPLHKHGFAAVVMVLNAVITFLVTLGGLIAAVVALLTLFTSTGDITARVIVIISSGVTATLGILLFLRILRTEKLVKFSKIFPFIVVIIAGIALIMSLVGPFRAQVAGRDDRLIEQGLPSITQAVQTYATKNKKLPESLKDVSPYSQEGRDLISQNKVEYKVTKNFSSTTNSSANSSTSTSQSRLSLIDDNYNYGELSGSYQICVTYKKAKKSPYSYANESNSKTYIYTDSHNAGRQCYDQTTQSYLD